MFNNSAQTLSQFSDLLGSNISLGDAHPSGYAPARNTLKVLLFVINHLSIVSEECF